MRQCAFLRIDGSSNMNQTKVSCKYLGIPFPIFYIKSMIHNACMLYPFVCMSGLQPDSQVIDIYGESARN